MLKSILVVSLFFVSLIVSAAEQAQKMPSGEEDPGPIYDQMMKQWADTTNFAKNATEMVVDRLTMDLKADARYQKLMTPELKSDLEQFFYALFASKEAMVDLAKLYSQYFSLDEMGELMRFYKTPIGQKLIKTNSEITLKTQQLSLQLLKKHEMQYMEVLAKHLKPALEENRKKAVVR